MCVNPRQAGCGFHESPDAILQRVRPRSRCPRTPSSSRAATARPDWPCSAPATRSTPRCSKRSASKPKSLPRTSKFSSSKTNSQGSTASGTTSPTAHGQRQARPPRTGRGRRHRAHRCRRHRPGFRGGHVGLSAPGMALFGLLFIVLASAPASPTPERPVPTPRPAKNTSGGGIT